MWSLLLGLILLAPSPPMAVAFTSAQRAPTSPRICLNGGPPTAMVPGNVTVAVVKPVFTSTPYSQYTNGSYYAFFRKYLAATGNITTDLGWLSTSVRRGTAYNSGWGHTLPLYNFLSSAAARNCGLHLGRNLAVVSDINITQGALFAPDGSNRFTDVVIGHEEYVTQAEFGQLRRFVASGGRLIAMGANMFYAEVTFNPGTQAETLVVGHGYAFNGMSAWRTQVSPFNRSMSGWLGSTYCCFHRFTYVGGAINRSDPIGSKIAEYVGGTLAPYYVSHEENAVSNFTHTSVVATFVNRSGLVVASYVHHYGLGAVFCLCIFGEDVIVGDASTQLFLLLSLTGGAYAATTQSQLTPSPQSGTFRQAVIYLGAAAVVVTTAVVLFFRRKP